MSRAWKELDLGGAGLQSVNMQLARLLKRRGVAYAAWLLFPLGAHRAYLEEPWGRTAYLVLTTLAAILWLALGPAYAAAPIAAEGAFALFDLYWVERRRVAMNKEIRKAAYLSHGATPPTDYRGRQIDDEVPDPATYLDDYMATKEGGAGRPRRGHRVPSFQEQEAMLRAMQRGDDSDASEDPDQEADAPTDRGRER